MRTLVRLAVVALPVLWASCSKKQEAPPVAQQAPTTTTVPPTTTLPPPIPTPVPTPPPVWREARWGMTKAAVLAAFPKEAQRLEKPAEFAQPQHGSSLPAGSSDIAIPTFDGEGATFRVLFGFEQDALNRIHLGVPKATATTCPDIENALTGEHGPPAKRSPIGTSLKGEEIVWTLPDQTIVLSCVGVARLGFVTASLDHLASPASAVATRP
jgi:hypothetical protein